MKPTIAFLGTGLMGEPMCHNLLEAGLPLTVWNRSTEKTKRLAKRGAKAPDSPHDAVADADVVISGLDGGEVTLKVNRKTPEASADVVVGNQPITVQTRNWVMLNYVRLVEVE